MHGRGGDGAGAFNGSPALRQPCQVQGPREWAGRKAGWQKGRPAGRQAGVH